MCGPQLYSGACIHSSDSNAEAASWPPSLGLPFYLAFAFEKMHGYTGELWCGLTGVEVSPHRCHQVFVQYCSPQSALRDLSLMKCSRHSSGTHCFLIAER